MKQIRVVFSKEAEEAYRRLDELASVSKIEKSLLNSIHKKVELIKLNPHYGNPVAKNLIPKEYTAKYGITNLFRVELPKYWRMLYTLTNGDTEIEIIAFVLDVVSHKEYNRKFGYE